MSQTEWMVRSGSLLAAVVLLAVPLATDTKSDQDQAVPGASAVGGAVPLPPELARYGEARSRPFLSSYRLPDTITFAGSTVPLRFAGLSRHSATSLPLPCSLCLRPVPTRTPNAPCAGRR